MEVARRRRPSGSSWLSHGRAEVASTSRRACGDVVEGVAPPLDGRAVQSSDRVPTPDTVAFIVGGNEAIV